jgi:hypothetical protein
MDALGQEAQVANAQEMTPAEQPPGAEGEAEAAPPTTDQQWQDDAASQSAAQAGGGNQPPPPSQQRERPKSHERLGIDGVPLELEGSEEGDVDTNTAADGETDTQGGTFEQSGGGMQDGTIQAGADPLVIPPDLRHVVQNYFSPQE